MGCSCTKVSKKHYEIILIKTVNKLETNASISSNCSPEKT